MMRFVKLRSGRGGVLLCAMGFFFSKYVYALMNMRTECEGVRCLL